MIYDSIAFPSAEQGVCQDSIDIVDGRVADSTRVGRPCRKIVLAADIIPEFIFLVFSWNELISIFGKSKI